MRYSPQNSLSLFSFYAIIFVAMLTFIPFMPAQAQEKSQEQEQKQEQAQKIAPSLDDFDHYFSPDPISGLAISAFDPVAYHLEYKARSGSELYEYRYQNLIWRFANAGNLAAFEDNPSSYLPAFSAYDIIRITQGFFAVGDPEIWAIYKGRTYFFRSIDNRALFAQNPQLFIQNAIKQWPPPRRSPCLRAAGRRSRRGSRS